MKTNNKLAIFLAAEALIFDYARNEKVADLYDDDQDFCNALHDLIPDLEYPDISYLTVGDIIDRFVPEEFK